MSQPKKNNARQEYFGSFTFFPIHEKAFQRQFVLKSSPFEFELGVYEFNLRWFILTPSELESDG